MLSAVSLLLTLLSLSLRFDTLPLAGHIEFPVFCMWAIALWSWWESQIDFLSASLSHGEKGIAPLQGHFVYGLRHRLGEALACVLRFTRKRQCYLDHETIQSFTRLSLFLCWGVCWSRKCASQYCRTFWASRTSAWLHTHVNGQNTWCTFFSLTCASLSCVSLPLFCVRTTWFQ